MTRLFLGVVAPVAIALLTLVAVPAASWAAVDYPGNQSLHQPAQLMAPDPQTQIAIYPKPDAGLRRVGYGISGDAVTILERIGGHQSVAWNRIRFEQPPHAEGWVQAEFVSLAGATASTPDAQSPDRGDRYLGGRPLQPGRQRRSPAYSQQTQY